MIRLVSAFAALWALAAAAPAAAAQPHHEIDATYDPETRKLSVVDTITATKGASITFRIADWLSITGATLGHRPLEARRDGHVWRIVLPTADPAPLILQFSGSVPPLPEGGARRRNGDAVAGTEGSFLPGHAGWIADTGHDRVTYRLILTIKGGQTGVATGRLSGESRTGDTYRATFTADYPTEPPALFIGPYTVKERRADGIRIRSYFHADIANSADHYLDASARYIRDFADRIGPYPFDDFHIVSAPLPVGLGFPNLTYIGRMIVRLPFMRGRSLAHEVLHNWWGNGVAIDYATGNWAEGLTSYMADYGLTVASGPETAREMRLGWLRDFAALPATRDMPVTAFTAKTHQASQIIGYNKVSHIFHMLQQELGEDKFAAGLRLFWQRHKFAIAGWADIANAFERAAGRPLDGFFTQWLNRPGAPRIELVAARAITTGEKHAVELTLRQDQPVYDIAVPVVIGTGAGEVRKRMRLRSAEQHFEIALQDRPTSVAVDPDFDLFRRLLPGESPPILRDITLAPAVRVMLLEAEDTYIAAGRALAARLVEGRTVETKGDAAAPVLVIGRGRQIADYLTKAGMDPVPARVTPGTAAAWATRGPEGRPTLFIRADGAESLRALMRPLPHYGSRSFVVFEGRRATDKGAWRPASSPLSITLND